MGEGGGLRGRLVRYVKQVQESNLVKIVISDKDDDAGPKNISQKLAVFATEL